MDPNAAVYLAVWSLYLNIEYCIFRAVFCISMDDILLQDIFILCTLPHKGRFAMQYYIGSDLATYCISIIVTGIFSLFF
jgi:hypothetical protein